MPEAHTIPVRAALSPIAAVEIEVDKLDDSQHDDSQHDAPSFPSPSSPFPPDTDLFDDSEGPARACAGSQEEESEASAQSTEGVEPAADHGTAVRPALSSTPSSTRPRVIHTLSNTTTPPSPRPTFTLRSVSRQGRSSSTLDLKSLGGIPALDPLTPSSPHLQTAPPPSPSAHPKTSDSTNPTHQIPPQKSPSSSLSGLRACAETKECLYPGSTFVGTQKSGRNSYPVTLTIFDVNLADSTVSGSLKISGLTHERPELTTFFEGEIVGPRFGFLTNKWDATKGHDNSHWQRFPLFRHLLPGIRQTDGWTMPSPIVSVPCDSDSASPDARPNREAGLFMRFKEKCLLPDYRVKSISGASFEGFYYAALLFDDELSKRDGTGRTSGRRTPVPISRTPSSTVGPSSAFSSFSAPLPQPARTSSGSEYSSPSPPPSMTARSLPHPPDPSTDTPRPHDPPRAPTSPPEERTSAIPGDAVITGFYFHVKNSEPFQELSLRHVKEYLRPTFEFA